MQAAAASPAKAKECAETRERLLEAAGEVFAEQGFRCATVRDICQRANANIAAVNYHFGDKRRLYAAVLTYAQRAATEKYPPDFGLRNGATPEERLHAFVLSLLLRMLADGQPTWHGKLLSREMIDPSSALDELAEGEFKPRVKLLDSIVRDLIGKKAGKEYARLCAMSIVGQAHFHHHAQAVIARLYPDQGYTQADIERLADHITQFTLAALRGLAERQETPRRKPRR